MIAHHASLYIHKDTYLLNGSWILATDMLKQKIIVRLSLSHTPTYSFFYVDYMQGWSFFFGLISHCAHVANGSHVMSCHVMTIVAIGLQIFCVNLVCFACAKQGWQLYILDHWFTDDSFSIFFVFLCSFAWTSFLSLSSALSISNEFLYTSFASFFLFFPLRSNFYIFAIKSFFEKITF